MVIAFSMFRVNPTAVVGLRAIKNNENTAGVQLCHPIALDYKLISGDLPMNYCIQSS